MASSSAVPALEALVRKVDADPKSGEVLWLMRTDDGVVAIARR